MAGTIPTMRDGDERFGKQDPGPWLDVREAFGSGNPLRTFRDHVEAWVKDGTEPSLPKGYLGAVSLRADDPAYDVVIVGHRGYMGELLAISFDRLMAGTKLTWRFELEDKRGT